MLGETKISKIENDKYYTPISVANLCIDRVIETIGLNCISDVIEPAVGDGSFLHHSVLHINLGYDILPECKNTTCEIIEQDYLTTDLPYRKGRLVIGNPPYGRCMNLAQKFYKKAVTQADYIAFILPISQFNNNASLYEFDLIDSTDLGIVHFTDRKLHCCFNIYKRPINGALNHKPKTSLEDISIYRQDSTGYADQKYDLRMCYWGNGSAGKILSQDEHYSAEYKILIHNEQLKDSIIAFLESFDWKAYLNCIAMRKIQQFHIIAVLKEQFSELK